MRDGWRRESSKVARQVPVPIIFEGHRFYPAFRVDILVEDRLVLEIKAVEQISIAHAKQLLIYLRLLNQPAGLLLNFSGETMKEGLRRMVNNHVPENTTAPSLSSAALRETP